MITRALFWIVPLLTSAYFMTMGLWFDQLATESATWPRTTAVITNVTIREEDPRRTTWFDAWVSYQYEVGTETYTAQEGPYMLDRYTNESIDRQEATERATVRFPQGKLIEVAYDPANHGRSTLQMGQPQRARKNFSIGFVCLAVALWQGWDFARFLHKQSRV
jgi:hypothetical protein